MKPTYEELEAKLKEAGLVEKGLREALEVDPWYDWTSTTGTRYRLCFWCGGTCPDHMDTCKLDWALRRQSSTLAKEVEARIRAEQRERDAKIAESTGNCGHPTSAECECRGQDLAATAIRQQGERCEG